MLIAAAGFAGAGKTTALQVLARAGLGSYEYVGGIVRSEVVALGLELNPQNEHKVRADLRERHGPAALATLALPELRRKAAQGPVLVDAICNIEERQVYLETLGNELVVIGLQAKASIRAKRLAERADRPITAQQLAVRDRYETETLRLSEVISAADCVIHNEATLAEFEAEVISVAATWR